MDSEVKKNERCYCRNMSQNPVLKLTLSMRGRPLEGISPAWSKGLDLDVVGRLDDGTRRGK